MNATKTEKDSCHLERAHRHQDSDARSSIARWRSAVLALLLVGTVATGCSGFKGHVYDSWPEASAMTSIKGAHIVFKKDDGSELKATHGDIEGEYKVDLSTGWYNVTATAPGYKDFSSPAPAHVAGGGYDRFDIHMEKR